MCFCKHNRLTNLYQSNLKLGKCKQGKQISNLFQIILLDFNPQNISITSPQFISIYLLLNRKLINILNQKRQLHWFLHCSYSVQHVKWDASGDLQCQ